MVFKIRTSKRTMTCFEEITASTNYAPFILSKLAILFLFLDIYYLQLERKYRYLYEQVRSDNHDIDFSMVLTKNKKAARARIWDCLLSPSIWLFYPAMIAILVAVFAFKLGGML